MYSIGQKNVIKKKVKKIVMAISSKNDTGKPHIMIELNHSGSGDQNGSGQLEMSWDWRISVVFILGFTTVAFDLSCN